MQYPYSAESGLSLASLYGKALLASVFVGSANWPKSLLS